MNCLLQRLGKAATFVLTLASFILAAPLLPNVPQSVLSGPVATAHSANYVGDQECRACHARTVESYFRTAHHRTSRIAARDSILGSFSPGKNLLKTSYPDLSFRMEAKASGFYVTSETEFSDPASKRSERLDLVLGSGRIGQTYLYWKGDRLFELPVSYWTALGTWISSPGYLDDVGNFDRPVTPRCLECHVGYAESTPGPDPPNRYYAARLVMGISCERCHGPGRQHVDAMKSLKPLQSIINPAKLTRDERVEVCAQCHNGLRKPVAPAFSYLPGKPLDNYFEPAPPDPSPTGEVHGNQVGLLRSSRCFQASPAMNCATCHNVHQTERDAASYSRHCLACHESKSCGEFRKLGEKIAGNCVDCHMPVLSSSKIISLSNGKEVKANIRTHWIKVYPKTRMP